jgi:hypothetical protein
MSDMILDKGNNEFVYSPQVIVDMKGKTWARTRNYINKMSKMEEEGEIKTITLHTILPKHANKTKIVHKIRDSLIHRFGFSKL